MTARERYEQACRERGIPIIVVSPKVAKACKGFGKIPTFPARPVKYVDSDYRDWNESRKGCAA